MPPQPPQNVEQTLEAMIATFITYLPQIGLTFLLALVLHFLVRLLMAKFEASMALVVAARSDRPGEVEKRMKTLFELFRRTAVIIVWVLSTLVILNTLNIRIAPILAAAGVLGLAVSLGAQSLIKDFIAGIILLFENQFRLGDVATINGTTGVVESINLRTVVLRDLTGTVHVIPNGNIVTVANQTKDWSAALMDIGVAYKEDLDKVFDIMKATAEAQRKDPAWEKLITDDIEIFGLDQFGDSALVIKCRIKVVPMQQWAVARDFRGRLKKAFDAAAIEIPFPHRTIYFGEASLPIKIASQAPKA